MLKWQAVLRAASIVACLLHPTIAPAQYVVENLGRGVIAIRASETPVYVGWRLLGTDPVDLAFNVYRATGSASPVKVNAAPVTATTNLVDAAADLRQTNSYTVRPVLQGTELPASAPFLLPANSAAAHDDAASSVVTSAAAVAPNPAALTVSGVRASWAVCLSVS